jgi:hypothetical protein
MSMTEHVLERTLEWEPAADPIVLEHVVFSVPPFISGMRKLTIERDEQFRLSLLAEGFLANRNELMLRREASDKVPAGTFVDLDEAIFEAHGGRCSLTAALHDVPDATFASDDPRIRFQQRGKVYRFTRTWSQKFVAHDGREPSLESLGPPSWRSDWFVNGPHDPICMRSTSRRRHVALSRSRQFGTVKTPELPQGPDGRDHFVVDAGAIRFALCQVPKDAAPEWCHAVSIEFREPVPDADTRTAVWEIVSFVLGRRLIPIGSTLFDESGWAIEEETVNPISGDGLRELCSEGDMPPVPLRMASADIEAVLAKLVPKYLELRDRLDLRNALWGYWSACEAATPIDLAIFRASVEALKKGWYAGSEAKPDGNYIPKDAFDEITRDVFATVEQRLTNHSAAKEIMNNLRCAYRMSGNEEVRMFFTKIGLDLGAVEKAAIGAANVPAHGTMTPGDKMKEYVVHGRAYRTLFARTFLRLLGYHGSYLDRTAPGSHRDRSRSPQGFSLLRRTSRSFDSFR